MALCFAVPTAYFTFVVGPTRHIFNYLTAQPSPAWMQYTLGLLGVISFYTFGPFAEPKENDPYDMTEVWEEFKLRAAIGKKLAEKDVPDSNGKRNGFVQIAESEDQKRQASKEMQNIGPANLSALLEALGLQNKYSNLESEVELEDLKALQEHDVGACLNELDKAGVSLGDRLKIIRHLNHGCTETEPAFPEEQGQGDFRLDLTFSAEQGQGDFENPLNKD